MLPIFYADKGATILYLLPDGTCSLGVPTFRQSFARVMVIKEMTTAKSDTKVRTLVGK